MSSSSYRGINQPTTIVQGSNIPANTVPAAAMQQGIIPQSNQVSTTQSLTLSQCGLVEINATAGSIVLTLPAAASSNTAQYNFVRTDNTANTVTILTQGADTFDLAGNTSISLGGKDVVNSAVSNGIGIWYTKAAITSNKYLAVSVAGAGNVTLTQTQAAFEVLNLTGLLTGNIIVYFPQVAGKWIVNNSATGSFNLLLMTTSGSLAVNLPQGSMEVWSDGLNIYNGINAANQGSIGRNVIVNGDCSVSQVNGTTLITPTDASYPIDNVMFKGSQASKLQTQQVSNVLNSLGAVTSLTTSVLAQYTSISTDYFGLRFPIEGLNFARFAYGTANAKTGSLQFKARASVAGTYSGAINNYAFNRSYPFTFVLAANTDTLVTIPNIPGDTGGTWVGATNAGAAIIAFDTGSGTNFKSTASSWQTGNFVGVTGSTNLVSQVNGSTLTITDVQFEVGAFCTTFERKLYDQVLRECQRYLPSFYGVMTLGSGYAPAGNTGWIYVKLPVTGILVSALTDIFIEYDSTAVVVSALALGTYSGTDGVQLNMTSATSPITLGRGVIGQIQSGVGRVTFTGAQI